jgi:hypothetical protein
MAVFPAYGSVGYANPLRISLEFKTLSSKFDDLGEENRKRKWLYPKRQVVLSYNYITKAEAKTLWQFYQARYGPYEAFAFFIGISDDYVNEYVGTGDGVTTIFNLTSKNASSYSLYVNGILMQGGGVEYTFTAVGGSDGEDKIEFVVTPAEGDRITFDFSGELKIRCKFKEDILTFDLFYDRLVNEGIALQGELNA